MSKRAENGTKAEAASAVEVDADQPQSQQQVPQAMLYTRIGELDMKATLMSAALQERDEKIAELQNELTEARLRLAELTKT